MSVTTYDLIWVESLYNTYIYVYMHVENFTDFLFKSLSADGLNIISFVIIIVNNEKKKQYIN